MVSSASKAIYHLLSFFLRIERVNLILSKTAVTVSVPELSRSYHRVEIRERTSSDMEQTGNCFDQSCEEECIAANWNDLSHRICQKKHQSVPVFYRNQHDYDSKRRGHLTQTPRKPDPSQPQTTFLPRPISSVSAVQFISSLSTFTTTTKNGQVWLAWFLLRKLRTIWCTQRREASLVQQPMAFPLWDQVFFNTRYYRNEGFWWFWVIQKTNLRTSPKFRNRHAECRIMI